MGAQHVNTLSTEEGKGGEVKIMSGPQRLTDLLSWPTTEVYYPPQALLFVAHCTFSCFVDMLGARSGNHTILSKKEFNTGNQELSKSLDRVVGSLRGLQE